jgi:hypothetical protein
MGAFWNPHGGVVFGSKKLTKKEVSNLKRKWSAQRDANIYRIIGWWHQLQRLLVAIFKAK